MQLPANFLTIQQFFEQAPEAERNGAGVGVDHVVEIHGNRQANRAMIAGHVCIHKSDQAIEGIVTEVNYEEGWFIVGDEGRDASNLRPGTMVRINDPASVHSKRSGLGCSVSKKDERCATWSPLMEFPSFRPTPVTVGVELYTEGDLNYIIVDEAEWDAAPYSNLRFKSLHICSMSDHDHAVLFRLSHNFSGWR
jgi:hypothetical protein